jgi:membrane protein
MTMVELTKRVWAAAKRDNLPLLAAGVAFYSLLAAFPMIIALVTVYGLVADPDRVTEHLEPVTKAMPPDAASVLTTQLRAVAATGRGSLTFGLVLSLLVALWAASGGVSALITGINAVNERPEERHFVKLKALSLGLTFGAVVVGVAALLLIAAFPAVVSGLRLGTPGRVGAEVARWLLLAGVIGTGLSVFYWLGPSGTRPRWRWLTRGAVVALAIWVLGSVAFSIYVSNFGDYNKTYGALAAVVILMLWLYLSAYVVLFGAEVDAELNRTATPPPSP